MFAEVRLDRDMAAFAVADVVGVILDLGEQMFFLESFDDGFAAFESVQPAEIVAGGVGHATVGPDHDGERQIMAGAHLVVGRVVGRGDFDAAGTELRIDEFVADDGDGFVAQRQEHLAPDQGAVPFVVRVDGDGLVAEHGLGAGGGDGDKLGGRQGRQAGSGGGGSVRR